MKQWQACGMMYAWGCLHGVQLMHSQEGKHWDLLLFGSSATRLLPRYRYSEKELFAELGEKACMLLDTADKLHRNLVSLLIRLG